MKCDGWGGWVGGGSVEKEKLGAAHLQEEKKKKPTFFGDFELVHLILSKLNFEPALVRRGLALVNSALLQILSHLWVAELQ